MLVAMEQKQHDANFVNTSVFETKEREVKTMKKVKRLDFSTGNVLFLIYMDFESRW